MTEALGNIGSQNMDVPWCLQVDGSYGWEQSSGAFL